MIRGRMTQCIVIVAGLALSSHPLSSHPLSSHPLSSHPARATEHHVSPGGGATGDGSIAKPWSLMVALSHPPTIQPGDTIWLHGGTYAGGVTSTLAGTASAPITVRSFPGEWARMDGKTAPSKPTLTLDGAWTRYRNFEVMNSETHRGKGRPIGLHVNGRELKLINLVIHDLGNNGFWTPATNLELYGNVIYHNGYDDADRGHGHGIYTQNRVGTKVISDNIIFGGYSFGIHVYTQGGFVEGFDIVGNVLFNAGVLSSISGHKDDCLIGGFQAADRVLLKDNFSWAPTGTTRSVRLGWNAANKMLTMTGNYFVGRVHFAMPWSPVSISGNTFTSVVGINRASYPRNTYLFRPPTVTKVFLRPNKYEAGRAHIIVYNWAQQANASVDVSAVLSTGAKYEIRNAQNYFGPLVSSGTYTGTAISLPLSGLTPAQPIGSPGAYKVADQTGNKFNVFVLTTAGAN